MRLVPVEVDVGHETDGDWWRWQTWTTPAGMAELWFGGSEEHRSLAEAPVRVTGTVPHAVSPLGRYDWSGWRHGGRTEAEQQLVQGLEVEVDGHGVTMRMPKRGWTRDDRRLFVTVDGTVHVARPRAWGSVQLTRPDGSPVWRTRIWGRPRLGEDVTPIEVTVAALLELADVQTRLVHQPVNAI